MSTINKINKQNGICNHCLDSFKKETRLYIKNCLHPDKKFVLTRIISGFYFTLFLFMSIFQSTYNEFSFFMAGLSLMIFAIFTIIDRKFYLKWYKKETKSFYNDLIQKYINNKGIGEENGVFYSFDGMNDVYYAQNVNDTKNTIYGKGDTKKSALFDLCKKESKNEALLSENQEEIDEIFNINISNDEKNNGDNFINIIQNKVKKKNNRIETIIVDILK